MGSVWQENIFNILCAHLRQTTKHKEYTLEERFSYTKKTKEIKPTEEVQILLSILFTRCNNNDTIFDKLIANLEESNLKEAFLQGVDLQDAKINKHTTMPPNWENVVKKTITAKQELTL